MRAYNVAVVGATGAVGQELLKVLAERKFPTATIRLLASARSVGKRIAAMGSEFEILEANPNSFDGIDIAFFAAGGVVSKLLAPEAARRGAIVVDKSSAWRMEPSVPLIIPEVNPADIDAHQGIISNPNCSTIVMLMALAPLHRANPLKNVVVDTYQSASGAGVKGIDELIQQTKAILGNNEPQHTTFPHPLAFNVIPQVEDFTENGYTTEEIKMEAETQKILHLPGLPVSATCVRVPVTNSHSEAVHVGFTHPMTPEEAREILVKAPGVRVFDEIQRERYPMAPDASGKDEILVGRIRKDHALNNGLTFWTVGDNLRKGAALNACQIAEETLKREILPPSQARR